MYPYPGKLLYTVAIAAFLIPAMIDVGRAQNVTSQATLLTLKVEQLKLHRTPPVYRAYVTAESGKFTFLIPTGLRAIGGAEDKVRLSNLEGNVLITFSIVDPTPCSSEPLNADGYREMVQARHPGGKIIEQLSPGAAGRIGIGFDMKWETTNRFAQCTRTVFIPSAAGLLEFTATTAPQKFSDLRYDLGQLMLGFRAATPGGELEVPKVPDGGYQQSDAGRFQGKGLAGLISAFICVKPRYFSRASRDVEFDDSAANEIDAS